MMPWDANSRVLPVATEDLAQVIVAIRETPVTHSGKTYPLCGPAAHSFAEVAEIARRRLGTQITYQQAECRYLRRVDCPNRQSSFPKSTAEQSHVNCKKEFSLERTRLLRRSAVAHR